MPAQQQSGRSHGLGTGGKRVQGLRKSGMLLANLLPRKAAALSGALFALAVLLPATPAAAQQTPSAVPTANWSGYVATNAYYTGVSALVRAPEPYAIQRLGVVASWVGVGGATSDDLIQMGIEEVNSGQYFTYEVWYEMLPDPSRRVIMIIQPAAWVSFDIRELAHNTWRLTAVNGTNVWQRVFVYPSSHSSVEWIVEDPAISGGKLLPLAGVTGANFAKMGAIANGKAVTPSQLFPKPAVIVSPVGDLRAAPTPLTEGGTAFSVDTVAA